ncbi:MAG: hypothetical protein EB078_12065, partial [Proteobacteria bacterium]|nr:hypothetical protein [Pseudomonadota bacterium]NDD05634.1 hypothetical protein [Pseudomonadota bacterium]
MKSFSLLITLLFLNTPIALARPLAPLMPPRERASVISSSMPTAKKQLARSERQAFGLETGLVGIGNNSSGDIAKLQLVFGLRANYIFPISQRFFLKPSIGF